jgi:type IV pilus assembly protein PilQ
MKTLGRLLLFCFFAAAGVGLALYVGTSAGMSPLPLLVARPASVAADPSSPVADALPAVLPPPPEAAPAVPARRYGQKVVPPPDEPLPSDLLHVARSEPAAAENAPVAVRPTPPASKATVTGQRGGRLQIHIHDEDIRKVLDLLGEQGNLNILASKSVEGKVSATLNDVDIAGALAAILKSTGYVFRREGNFLFVGTPDDFSNLDQATDHLGARTYRTNYITAAELRALIAPLLTEKVGMVSVAPAAGAALGAADAAAAGNRLAGGELLVVRDYTAVLDRIDRLVAEVDVRPPQVAIEALIVSVKLSDADHRGVSFQSLCNPTNPPAGLGAPAGAASGVALAGGSKLGFLDAGLDAFLEALHAVGDTRVIAAPRWMALNKQRAEIHIGNTLGYVNQAAAETASTPSVGFLKTGLQLRLRPWISNDGLIRMEIQHELSDGDVALRGGLTLPNKSVTQATTNVMVGDGCTVVIGGLIHQQAIRVTTRLPVLGSLPWVGCAFRRTTEAVERHEVLLLITPRIVYEPAAGRSGR